jgi:hypothetical protein
MRRPGLLLVSLGAWTSLGLGAYGRDFTIRLEARTGDQEQAAESHSQASAARPVLTGKAKRSLRVQWSVASADKATTVPDVTVHCFLAREGAIGQQALPDLKNVVEFESALSMDFAPGAQSSAEIVLPAPAPGNYLLRVETINADDDDSQRDFAALDLKVP